MSLARRHALRVLFTLSVIWAVLLGLSQELFAWTTDRPNGSALDWLIAATVCLVSVGVTCAMYIIWPEFLRIPRHAGVAAVFVRLLLIGAAVFLLAGAGFAVIEYVRPIDRAGNPQHGLSVVIAAVWYPSFSRRS